MISTNITYEVGRTRIDDLRVAADRRRRAHHEPEGSRSTPRSEHRSDRSRRPLRAFGALRLRRA